MKRLSVCGTLFKTKVNVKPCLKRLSVCGTLYETVECMWNPV